MKHEKDGRKEDEIVGIAWSSNNSEIKTELKSVLNAYLCQEL